MVDTNSLVFHGVTVSGLKSQFATELHWILAITSELGVLFPYSARDGTGLGDI